MEFKKTYSFICCACNHFSNRGFYSGSFNHLYDFGPVVSGGIADFGSRSGYNSITRNYFSNLLEVDLINFLFLNLKADQSLSIATSLIP